MKLTFAHGWGFDASFWNPVREPIDFPQEQIEFGFLGASPQLEITGDIAVGHSFGLLWLLSQNHPWKAVIAINSFTCFQQNPTFSQGIPKRILERMHTLLHKDPERCVKEFYTNIGAGGLPQNTNPQQLLWGLDLLSSLDCREYPSPIHALHSRDDPLISTPMAQACFDNIEYTETGGHLLPLSSPSICKDFIDNIVHQLT